MSTLSCNACSISFNNWKDLNAHALKQKHTPQRCQGCNKTFKLPQAIYDHARTTGHNILPNKIQWKSTGAKHNNFQFQCGPCNKHFGSSTALRQHKVAVSCEKTRQPLHTTKSNFNNWNYYDYSSQSECDSDSNSEEKLERKFGHFKCKKCKKNWKSGYAYAKVRQDCKKCKQGIFPYALYPLQPGLGTSTREHMTDKCHACRVGRCDYRYS
jgi:hypothetical protein